VIVLGIDTSTQSTAAALSMADGASAERRDDPSSGSHPGHATRLLAMVDELLAQEHTELAAVTRVAAGAGPGTFTGLRVGLATARGLAQSLGCELVAVSSLRALAEPALDRAGAQERPVLAAIDARRREVFAAVYSPAGEQLAAPRALPPAQIGTLLAEAGGAAALAVGDGARRYRAELEQAGAEVAAESSPLHLLRAEAVCELGRAATPVGIAGLAPEYLRRPDAELALEGGGRAPA
jgi:tRNA threonylcarbamoyladenosine biosynthesis protein TsaB